MGLNVTIRDLDERAYQLAKSKAALEKKTMGQVVSEALRMWTASRKKRRGAAIFDLLENPRDWGVETDARRIDDYLAEGA